MKKKYQIELFSLSIGIILLGIGNIFPHLFNISDKGLLFILMVFISFIGGMGIGIALMMIAIKYFKW